MRTTFKENVGELVKGNGAAFTDLLNSLRAARHPIASVGDTTTLNLVEGGVIPDLSVIDLGTRRGLLESRDRDRMERFLSHGDVVMVRNPQGEITTELWDTIREFYGNFHSRVLSDDVDCAEATAVGNGVGNRVGNGEDVDTAREKPEGDRKPDQTEYNKFKIGRPGRMGTTPLIIRIEGEEDLASLPCIYFANKGGHVLYGLPDMGLVHIQVDEKHRTIVRDALMNMEALYEPHNNESDR